MWCSKLNPCSSTLRQTLDLLIVGFVGGREWWISWLMKVANGGNVNLDFTVNKET
jgi:hypothetical protein